jgi:hypothetical protein
MAPPSQVERCPPNRVNSNSIGGDLWKAIEWAEAEQKAGRLKGLNLNAPMQSQ